jgi:hypothetical protein
MGWMAQDGDNGRERVEPYVTLGPTYGGGDVIFSAAPQLRLLMDHTKSNFAGEGVKEVIQVTSGAVWSGA